MVSVFSSFFQSVAVKFNDNKTEPEIISNHQSGLHLLL